MALVALRWAATGQLAPPSFASLDSLSGWSESRSTTTAVLAMVRLAAELWVWYLLGLSALQFLASVARLRGAASMADVLALPASGRLVRAGLGLSLVATTAVGSSSEPGTAAMRPVPAEPSTAWMVPTTAGTPRGTSTTIAPTTTTTSSTTTTSPTTTSPTRPPTSSFPSTRGSTVLTTPTTLGAATEADDAPTLPSLERRRPTSPATWTVETGDSLWSVAEEVLADAWGRSPHDAEIDPYWRQLLEANRHRLVDPDAPELIFRGQVLELPSSPPDPLVT